MKIRLGLAAIFFTVTGASISIFAQSAYASSAIEVGRIAKAVTVLINSPQSTGSGVLIQKNGNSYTVLTAAHVVRDQPQTFVVTTQDGQKYQTTSINSTKDTDIAVIKFESKTSQQIAKLGDPAKSSEGATVYVSGFPLATQVITDTIYNFTEGKVTANASLPLSYGYSLVYSNNTLPGMSGGPVFNTNGELIAIHGRGDFQENSKVSDINENVRIKTGFNLGITLSTVLKLSSSLGLNLPIAAPISPIASINASTGTVSAPKPKADDFFLQGVDRFRRGDWAGAIAMMDKAIQLNPQYLRAYTARAAANYMLNRLAPGLQDMESAIAIDPNYATGYVGKCFLLNELEQWRQALDNCDRAIDLAPNLAIAYNTRGVVNTSTKKFANAQTDLETAVKLDPKSYYAYSNLAVLSALRNNVQLAFKYIRQALEINPQSAGSRSLLGQLLVLTGDYQEGIKELNRAIAINPKLSTAYEYRAAAYLGLGNIKQAQIDAQFAQSVADSSPQGFIEDLSFLNQ
jgi:tetratricopeptide (TPR) repeat protein